MGLDRRTGLRNTLLHSFDQSDSRRCPLLNCVESYGFLWLPELLCIVCIVYDFGLLIFYPSFLYPSFLCLFYHPFSTHFCYFTFVHMFVTLSTARSHLYKHTGLFVEVTEGNFGFLMGMVVLRLIRAVGHDPPAASIAIPRKRGATSRRRRSRVFSEVSP